MSRLALLAGPLLVLPACIVANPFAALDTGDSATDTEADATSATSTTSTSDATADESESESGPKLDTPSSETDTGEGCVETIDVVFVMDVSTTMGEFFDVLEQELTAVRTVLDSYDLPVPPRYGLVVFVDDYTFVNAGASYADIEVLAADFAYWNEFTASNQQTMAATSNSTWPENSLDALFAAATEFEWRPRDATLRMVVHTTDDTFWNGPTTGNGITIERSYAETVDALRAGEIRMYTFAAALGGPMGDLDVAMGFFTDFEGQAPIPDQTGGRAYDIDAVLAGTTSIADQLDAAIADSYCEAYPVG